MHYPAPTDHDPRSMRVLFLALCASVLSLSISLAACAPAMAPQVGGAGAGSEVIMLTMEDKGTAINVRQGDIILIELERAGSTGYEWHLDEGYRDHFELLSLEEGPRPDEKGRMGGPVIQRWRLQTTAPGKTELVLRLYRQWEGKDQSADMFSVEITTQ